MGLGRENQVRGAPSVSRSGDFGDHSPPINQTPIRGLIYWLDFIGWDSNVRGRGPSVAASYADSVSES
jgi:hypothetical protein